MPSYAVQSTVNSKLSESCRSPTLGSVIYHAPTPRSFGRFALPATAPPPRSALADRYGSTAPYLLKVEVLVLLFRCHADIAARRQAPVVRLDLGPGDHLHQPLDIPQLSSGKPLLQPVGLADEVAGPAQRCDYCSAIVLERPRALLFPRCPKGQILRIELLHRRIGDSAC